MNAKLESWCYRVLLININGHCKAKERVAGANPTLGKQKCQLTFVNFWFCFTHLLVGLVQHVIKHYNFVYIFQMTIACSWIFGIVITFPMFLSRNFDKELDWCVCTWSEEWMGKAYSMVWFLFTGFFPVTFMIALYSQVVYTLWFTRSKPRGRQHCVQQVRNLNKNKMLCTNLFLQQKVLFNFGHAKIPLLVSLV